MSLYSSMVVSSGKIPTRQKGMHLPLLTVVLVFGAAVRLSPENVPVTGQSDQWEYSSMSEARRLCHLEIHGAPLGFVYGTGQWLLTFSDHDPNTSYT